MIAAVPQRRLAGLDCLLDHYQQLRRQLIQVDLPLQPIAEPRDGLGGVVAAPLKRRSTAAWTRRRAGWTTAATARVAAATARLEPWMPGEAWLLSWGHALADLRC